MKTNKQLQTTSVTLCWKHHWSYFFPWVSRLCSWPPACGSSPIIPCSDFFHSSCKVSIKATCCVWSLFVVQHVALGRALRLGRSSQLGGHKSQYKNKTREKKKKLPVWQAAPHAQRNNGVPLAWHLLWKLSINTGLAVIQMILCGVCVCARMGKALQKALSKVCVSAASDSISSFCCVYCRFPEMKVSKTPLWGDRGVIP